MIKLKHILVGAALCLFIAHPAKAASYSVVSGDSLYTVGKLFKTNSDTIIQLNSLKSTTIYPGQALNVPGDTYTVNSGDTLYLIAKKLGISLYDLQKANNNWSGSIYPGQKLSIPNGGTSSNNTNNTAKPIVSYNQSDLDLLSRLITSEAEDQPYNAKVAVGAVVLNRVRDSRFPNSISSVIYEKSGGYYQFTPVENGWINKAASEDSKKAAYEALYGKDPSNGAFYYFDDSTTNTWLWSKPLAARIGRMVFVY